MPPPQTPDEFKRVLETALLAAPAPLQVSELRRLFENDPGGDLVRRLLVELAGDWQGRGVELVQTASGWRFQTRPEYQIYLDRLKNERPPKYSRAVLETLAIIAYRQPVTRADVESIRGVQCGEILRVLMERDFLRIVGRSEELGRPFLYGTTRKFLQVFGLRRLEQLPPVDQICNAASRAVESLELRGASD